MRGKIMSPVIAVILLSGIIMFVGYGATHKSLEKESEQISTETESEAVQFETEKDEDTEEALANVNCEEYFEKAKHVTVEKVDRMTVDDLDGNSKTEYFKYLVSDVDFINHSDDTSDYAKALAGEELDDSLVEKTSFLDAFGFSYENKSAWDVLWELLKKNGFDQDMSDAAFDEDAHELTGQSIYMVNEKSSVLDKLIDGISYDELMESKVFYQTRDLENGVVVPDCITAVVQYRIGDETFTRTVFLQVDVNDLNVDEEE